MKGAKKKFNSSNQLKDGNIPLKLFINTVTPTSPPAGSDLHKKKTESYFFHRQTAPSVYSSPKAQHRSLFIHNFPQQCPSFSIPHTFRNRPKKLVARLTSLHQPPLTKSRPIWSDPIRAQHFQHYTSVRSSVLPLVRISRRLDRKVYICDGCLSVSRLVLTTQQRNKHSTGPPTEVRRRWWEGAKKNGLSNSFRHSSGRGVMCGGAVMFPGELRCTTTSSFDQCSVNVVALAISGCCTLWLEEWLWMQQHQRNLTGFTMRFGHCNERGREKVGWNKGVVLVDVWSEWF